jgi:hypothetical protein
MSDVVHVMSEDGYLHNLVLLKVVLIHDSTPTIVTTTSTVDIVILKAVLITAISCKALEVDILLAQTAVGVAVFVNGGSVVAAIGVEISQRLELVLNFVGAVVETAHENALGELKGRCFDAESACKECYGCETVHCCRCRDES